MNLGRLTTLTGESFRGKAFSRRKWMLQSEDWKHEHCQMCFAQIREFGTDGDYYEGYVTFTPQISAKPERLVGEGYTFVPGPQESEGSPLWVCPACFDRFHDYFGWRT